MPTSEAVPRAREIRMEENAPMWRVLLAEFHKAYEAWCRSTTTWGKCGTVSEVASFSSR